MRKKVRKALLALVLVLLTVMLTPCVYAETEDKIKVGFFAMDGYHNVDENGKRSGYGYDFLQLAARYTDLEYEYVGYDKSWTEMLKMLENGEIDLLTSAVKTELGTPLSDNDSRADFFDYTEKMIGTSEIILNVKADDYRYSAGDYKSYSGMRVGMIEGDSLNGSFSKFAAEKGFDYVPVFFDSAESVTEALQSGELIDAAVTSTLRHSKNEWILDEFDSLPFYAIVKKANTELLDKLNYAIQQMDANVVGWRTMLNNQYYGSDLGEVITFNPNERKYLGNLRESGIPLRVVVRPDCRPYSYFENGTVKGILPDIFNAVAEKLGVSYEIIETDSREEYDRIIADRAFDVIIDAVNDFYLAENNGLKITNSYFSTPLAVLHGKSNSLNSVALTRSNATDFEDYEKLYSDTITEYDTPKEVLEAILNGGADCSYMLLYCAQQLSSSDPANRFSYRILPDYSREFVFAVDKGADTALLCSLDKAIKGIDEDFINTVTITNTAYGDEQFNVTGFLYRHPLLFALISVLFVAIVFVAVILAQKNRRNAKELQRSRRYERFTGCLCDTYSRVLEVNLGAGTCRQYSKAESKIDVKEGGLDEFFGIARSEDCYPNDLPDLKENFDVKKIRQMIDKGEGEVYGEYRIKSESGEYRWYSIQMKIIPKDKDNPCNAMLLIKDINETRLEQEHSRKALGEALDAAMTANRSKSAFLSSMSHEIRTPLNAVIGYMIIAENGIDNREKVLHCIDSASVAAKHLLSIINDVLDISAMESGKVKLNKDSFDFKDMLSNITTIFYQQCRQKNVKFDILINSLTEEWVIGDAMRVSQIFINLLSNAVKFTDENGKVSLTVNQTKLTEDKAYFRFSVKDTGIGMSKEYLSHPFTPFEQENSSTAKKYGGTGLGMSITKNLIALMGGTISVDSEKGKGTCFTVSLEFDRAKQHNDFAETSFSNLRVLVVDDESSACEYLRTVFERCGIATETAESGEAAIELLKVRQSTDTRFDLCIIDWNMPGLDGVETTRLIHAGCDPDIPIIIATAYDISEFEEEAMKAGASKIVAKPLFQSTVFNLLVSVYGKCSIASNKPIPDLSNLSVLLAEDNDMNVEVAFEILNMAGVKVDVARNGEQAVDLFLKNGDNYDVILMDVQMPKLDGYEATRKIRESAHPKAGTIPIIAMTANAFSEDVTASFSAGMNGHLAKPVDSDKLYETLRGVLRERYDTDNE